MPQTASPPGAAPKSIVFDCFSRSDASATNTQLQQCLLLLLLLLLLHLSSRKSSPLPAACPRSK
jgi:hypothetical protein